MAKTLRDLVSDWEANGNSRPLGDRTSGTWHEAATQLLDLLNSDAVLSDGGVWCRACEYHEAQDDIDTATNQCMACGCSGDNHVAVLVVVK